MANRRASPPASKAVTQPPPPAALFFPPRPRGLLLLLARPTHTLCNALCSRGRGARGPRKCQLPAGRSSELTPYARERLFFRGFFGRGYREQGVRCANCCEVPCPTAAPGGFAREPSVGRGRGRASGQDGDGGAASGFAFPCWVVLVMLCNGE